MPKMEICTYSDMLCIWAYVAERRLEELAENFGDQITINSRFCSVFPDAWAKIKKRVGGSTVSTGTSNTSPKTTRTSPCTTMSGAPPGPGVDFIVKCNGLKQI